MESIRKGQVGELTFVRRCVEQGIVVCKPINDNNRYDYVVEINGEFKKVQVKAVTGDEDKAFFDFSTRSYAKNNGQNRTKVNYYTNIDYFACVDLDKGLVFLIPPPEKNSVTLRYNGGQKNSLMAKDYIF